MDVDHWMTLASPARSPGGFFPALQSIARHAVILTRLLHVMLVSWPRIAVLDE